MQRAKLILVVAVAVAAVASMPPTGEATSETTYVLTASKWKSQQTGAVEDAGGEIVWSHGATGIGVVTSSNPSFLDEVMASNRFQHGEEDVAIQWVDPEVSDQVELEEGGSSPGGNAVTPGDETFFGFQWNMISMEAPAAWATGVDGSGARVAVIDGGINDTHIDLAGQVDAACSTSFVPGLPFNFDNGDPSFPGFWHGTHVAGIIAAADNGLGTIGVAPGATIMGVKALDAGSGSFAAVIGAIIFASDPGSFAGFGGCQRADIINMSLGAAFFQHQLPGLRASLDKAVNFAGSKGVFVISAAGNNGLDFGQLQDAVIIPAESGSGVAISATGPTGFIFGATNFRRIASYTNFGESLVYVAGPGGDFVDAAGFPFDMVLSMCGGLGGTFYCFAAGTSMATPAASGVAALIVSANPGISKGALKAKLKNTADDEGKNGHDEFYGHGFVNARRAVTE